MAATPPEVPPVPDPTVLTTEQLHREVTGLQELVSTEIRHLSELTETKFEGFTSRLDDLAKRTAEQKEDTKGAVSAALAAAKEAVGQQTEASERSITKSETAVTKQMDGLISLIQTSKQGTDDKIDDLKSRMDRNEAAAMGGGNAIRDSRETSSVQRAWVASVISSVLAVIAVVGFVLMLTQRG